MTDTIMSIPAIKIPIPTPSAVILYFPASIITLLSLVRFKPSQPPISAKNAPREIFPRSDRMPTEIRLVAIIINVGSRCDENCSALAMAAIPILETEQDRNIAAFNHVHL
jgi:hypothetical protein